MRALNRLLCLITEHEWIRQQKPESEFEAITFHDRSLCGRCGADSRELWQVMDDDLQMIDLLYMRLAAKEKRGC